MPETSFDAILEVEDSLQEHGIFRSMVDDSPRHQDSYGTLVDFVRLTKWKAEHKFTPEVIAACLNYWQTNPNMQPPLRLIGLTLECL